MRPKTLISSMVSNPSPLVSIFLKMSRALPSRSSGVWVWDEPLPMASYLVTADIGRWNIRQGRTPGGIPEYVAVDPVLPDVTTTERGVTTTRTALDFFYEYSARAADLWSQKFGPYPFDIVGAIADNATYNGTPLGFSLETQTKPVYSAVRSSRTLNRCVLNRETPAIDRSSSTTHIGMP